MQAFRNWWYGIKYAQAIATGYIGEPGTITLCLNGLFVSFHKQINKDEFEALITTTRSLLEKRFPQRTSIGKEIYYDPGLNCLEFGPENHILVTQSILYIYLDLNLVDLFAKK